MLAHWLNCPFCLKQKEIFLRKRNFYFTAFYNQIIYRVIVIMKVIKATKIIKIVKLAICFNLSTGMPECLIDNLVIISSII